MIPFSPPKIYQELIDEVVDTLNSGWITTGPKTKQLEKDLAVYCGRKHAICMNSWTIAMELMLRWLGVGEGDEVILPAYTYCATANVILHCGATPVMVDSKEDFNLDVAAVKQKINANTKAIIPVDIGGFPCDYAELNELIREAGTLGKYQANNENQRKLGRIMLLSDAAHSLGAKYEGQHVGQNADVTVFSFHAVKNLTTAEGGAIVFNLDHSFNEEMVYNALNKKSLHGQSKDALAKTQKGNWKYDVEEAGYKGNMTDILASMGLVELRRYESETLPRRKEVFNKYIAGFKNLSWAILPPVATANKETSYHLFLLRIKNVSEDQRDAIIAEIFENDVSVNVHFQPLPLLSLYKNLGYKASDYPIAFHNYEREISLPVYFDLTDAQVETIIQAVKSSVKKVLG